MVTFSWRFLPVKQRHSVLNFWWPLNSGNGKDKDDPKVAMGLFNRSGWLIDVFF